MMWKFFVRRAFTSLVSVLVVTIVVFVLARVQGDPRTIYAMDNLPASQYAALGHQLGLDRPLIVQYGLFLDRLIHANLGVSYHQQRPVSTIILERLPATAKLALGGFLVSLILGIPVGVLSAVKRGTPWDYLGRVLAGLGHSVPSFWIAIMGIYFFAQKLDWLPAALPGGIDHYLLPCFALGWSAAAIQLRLVRSSLLEVLGSEYVKLARAKGVSPTWVIWRHALRNAILAPLTFAGLTLASLITGVVVIEVVFAWPGIGQLAVNAVTDSDYAVLQGVMLFITIFFLLTSLLVDILYAFVDPRIRYS